MVVSQKDIAKELNLSVATVSRSLNRDPKISPSTRARIFTCASKLGYRPKGQIDSDMMISERAFRNSYTVAAIIQAEGINVSSTPIGYYVVAGMSQAAHRLGVSLILHTVPVEKRDSIHISANQPRAMLEGKLDGAVLVYRFGEESVSRFARQIPCVSVAHYHPQTYVDYVGPDNMEGIGTIVEHLIDLGHRRIGYISYNYHASFFDERLSGFILGMTRGGISFSSKYTMKYDEGNLSPRIGLLKRWISEGITAIVCASDSVAKDVCHTLEQHKYRIPEDVSVTGFDNASSVSDGLDLTTVEVDFHQIGRFALEVLISRLDDPTHPRSKMIVDCKIKKGRTTMEPGKG